MTLRRAFLLLTLAWALLFLPALGSTEYKGEEPRRVLPAVAMLAGGNWIVPTLCGDPFVRKPPLINWLIAGSIHLTGVQNEWTARLPSVLAVALLGVTILLVGARWLGVETALIAALLAISHVGMIDKGRMAEIEAVYIALTGIATMLWLAAHRQNRSLWPQWLPAGVILGISFLAKGPVNLLFFYPLVISILWAERRARELRSPAHIAGFLVMFGVFALWAIPFHQQAPPSAGDVIAHQTVGRFTSDFNLTNWLLALPRGLSNFLPWILLAPLCWQRATVEREGAWYVAARRSLVAVFVIILLLPGMLPRYSQPLLIPMSILLAIALRDAPSTVLNRWQKILPFCRRATALPLVLSTVAVLCLGMVIYAVCAVTVIRRHDDLRPLGQRVNAARPPGTPLYILDTGYQPFYVYLAAPVIYWPDSKTLPAEAQLAIGEARDWKKLQKTNPTLQIDQKISTEGKKDLLLMRRVTAR